MEVTALNFKKLQAEIFAAIDLADFAAIDCEFTGLRKSNGFYSPLDTPEERYQKTRNAAQEFGVIQFGLTTFRYVKENSAYRHSTYCFYIRGQDREILCYDPSSLKFLADCGFDFNKLFKEGLSYLSMKESEDERASYKTYRTSTDPDSPPTPTPIKIADEPAKKFLRDVKEKLQKYLTAPSQEPPILLPGSQLNAYYRKILYCNVAPKFPNILIRFAPQKSDGSIEIRKFESEEERIEFLESERNAKLEDKIGFTHIIKYILEKGIPIIGHNPILDLLHLYHKFVAKLPDSFRQFKSAVRSTFPAIYDTKIIAKDPPFCADIPVTALGQLYSSLCDMYKPPRFEVEEGGSSYSLGGSGGSGGVKEGAKEKEGEKEEKEGGKEHNAGFDAFMTGVCFVTMVKTLEGENWKKKSVIHSKHLTQYANRINNMKSHDIPNLNLVGSDIVPDRSRIFIINCSHDKTSADINSLFHMLKPVKVQWIDIGSCFVEPIDSKIDANTCIQYLKIIQAECPTQIRVRLYEDAHTTHAHTDTHTTNTDTHTNTQAHKRKSQSSEEEMTDIQTYTPACVHDYKRLKSVGSDQMSQMTLNSPTEEDKGKKGQEKSDAFSVPDEW